MKITPLQIVLLIISLFALSRVYLRAREKVIPQKTAIFWVLLWILAIGGILMPATTTRLASFFGVGRGVDVIIYISLTLLFYLMFRLYVVIEDLRHEITSIVRQLALQKPQKRKNTKSSK